MEIIIILILIICNGILAMTEIALVSARKTRLETDAKRGSKSARTALRLANEPDTFLSTIQIGITLIGILTGLYSGDSLAGYLAEPISKIEIFANHAQTISQTLIVIIVTYLTLIMGELVPKRIGMAFAEGAAKIVAKPMFILSKIALPFVWFLSKSTAFTLRVLGLNSHTENNNVTEEEIKAIIQEGTEGGEIQEVEQDIVERVFNLGDRNISSIMTHRSDVVWLDVNDSNEEIKKTVQENLFSLYPVADEELDQILGIVYLTDLFGHIDAPGFDLRKVIRQPRFFPENLSVYNTLEQFKQEHIKYGIVTNEFGAVQGIITTQNILKALLGNIPGMGEEQEIIQREDGTWLVDGQCPFYDFLAYFDLEDLYNDDVYNTLSGLIFEILKRIPKTGEKLCWQNFEFEIVDMDGARIDKVLVKKQEETNTENNKL